MSAGFCALFTELPLAEIERLEQLQGAELNEAKKILATEATRLCRGPEAAAAAARRGAGDFRAAQKSPSYQDRQPAAA